MKYSYYIVVLLLACIVTGCADSASSIETGGCRLRGEVLLRDVYLNHRPNGGGVTLECAAIPYSVTTDSSGFWEINDISPGRYTFSFSKDHYVPLKASIIVRSDTVTIADPISLHPATEFDFFLDAIVTDFSEGQLYGHTSPIPFKNIYVSVAYAIGRTPNIDISDSTTYIGLMFDTQPLSSKAGGTLNFSTQFRMYDLTVDGKRAFASGDEMFVRAYPYLFRFTYPDPDLGRTITTGYGKGSEVLSTKIP